MSDLQALAAILDLHVCVYPQNADYTCRARLNPLEFLDVGKPCGLRDSARGSPALLPILRSPSWCMLCCSKRTRVPCRLDTYVGSVTTGQISSTRERTTSRTSPLEDVCACKMHRWRGCNRAPVTSRKALRLSQLRAQRVRHWH